MTPRDRSDRLHFRYFELALLLCWIAAVPPLARAQVSTADIVGTVTDATGAIVPGVTVTARNTDKGQVFTGASNERGEYVIPQLPAGPYQIKAEFTGFKTWVLPSVTLASGDRFRADVHLEIGSAEQSVEVTAAPPALQTDTATVSALVTQKEMADLPTSGRNFIQLAQLVPGGSTYTGGSFSTGSAPADRRRSTTVSMNGRTGAENNFLLDGLDNNQKYSGSIVIKPSQEAVAEMRVATNSFSAEFARTSGAAVQVITKSGTNDYHGSVFEFFRNQTLDARPPSLAYTAAKPPYHQNNFGGGMGGPIKKDRTFFFGNWETYKVNLGSVTLATVPTAAMKSGSFAGLATIYDVDTTVPDSTKATGYSRTAFPGNTIPVNRMNAVGRKIISYFPDPIFPTASNNYSASTTRAQTDHTLDTRVDHRFSDKNNAFLRYSYGYISTQLPNQLFPKTSDGYWVSGGGKVRQSVQGVGLNDVHTISNNMVLVLRAGYSRFSIDNRPQNYGATPATALGIPNVNLDAMSSGFPDFTFTNYTALGDGTFLPTVNFENTYKTSGSIQYIRGVHNFKFGGDFTRRQLNQTQSQEPRAQFNFTTAFTADPNNTGGSGNAMASLLMGYPATTVRERFLILGGYRMSEAGVFLMDDWRLNRWLTLNPGLRWDYYSPISEVAGRYPNFDFTAKKAVLPGVNGVGNTGGVKGDWNNFSPRMGFAAQVSKKTVIRGGFGFNYTPLMQGSQGSRRDAPYGNSVNIIPGNIKPQNRLSDGLPALIPNDVVNLSGTFYAQSFNFKIPYVIQYNVTLERELPFNLVASGAYVASLGRVQSGSNTSWEENGSAPGAAAVQTRRAYYSVYPNLNSLSVISNRYASSYNAMQATLGTRSYRGMTANLNYTWAHNIDKCLESGNVCSSLRYTGFAQYVLLRGDASSDIRHRVAFTWSWAVPYAKDSKTIIGRIAQNWRLNALGYWQTGLPLTVTQTGSQTNGATGTNVPNVVGDWRVADPSRSRWFNPAAFQAQANYVWGTSTINTLRGPHLWNLDAGLGRDFRFTERFTAQFRVESFDATNSVMFSNPVVQLGAPGFGSVLSVTGNRQSQVALKILF